MVDALYSIFLAFAGAFIIGGFIMAAKWLLGYIWEKFCPF